jgi:hypothetical protein
MLGSCSTGDGALFSGLLGGSSEAVTFYHCRAVCEEEIEFVFSRPVTVKSLNFTPQLSVASVEYGSTVKIRLGESPGPGRLITADLLVEDEDKNSINVLVTLRSRNNRMPQLLINELCTEFSSTSGRTEYIEFKMKSDGNLGAMRVFIIGNSNAARQTIYEFSPVEVKNGDYVTLHLRTIDPSKKNEYGDDLSESGGRNASPTGRDFWIPGNTKLFHRTGIVYVMDQDNNILNAVMISENPHLPWPRDFLADAATFLLEQSAWVGQAVNSSGTTGTRTINRDETLKENTNSNADWYVTVTSGLTPGAPNDPRRLN